MNTRSIKFRLIAWYAGWLGLVFLIFGLVVYKSLDYYLKQALREALERRTGQIARLIEGQGLAGDSLRGEIQNRFAPEANNRFTRVTVDGRVRYVSGPPTDGSFDPAVVPEVAKAPQKTFQPRHLRGGPSLLIAVLPVRVGTQHVIIEEGYPDQEIKATLHAWAVALVAGLTLLILLAVFGGYVIAQRALSPVDEVIQTAERISSQNLGERLPVPQTGDELERLSTALNHMIRRLEESFEYTKRFLADASHELRTPLTILQAELESVIDKTSSDPGVRDIAGSALEEVERLRNIVEGLFALSRLDAGEALNRSDAVDLCELVASTTEQMSLLAVDKRVAITCAAPGRIVVHGDRSRLKQVVVNLLDNAIKYTPEGGRIQVSVTGKGNVAVLQVEDTGIGIPGTALPHVFDRFFRVDKARSRRLGGAGLGLSIVRSICSAHGGRVSVRSKEGDGSEFTVELPLAAASAGRAVAAEVMSEK